MWDDDDDEEKCDGMELTGTGHSYGHIFEIRT